MRNGGCVDDRVHVLVFTSTLKTDVKANVLIEEKLEMCRFGYSCRFRPNIK